MEKLPSDPLLVIVLGPTASGKTALSLALAQRFHGEIVNCDSVAMYREFNIGTAKPDSAERVRVPHHLLDCIAPSSNVTAGEYARMARPVLDEVKVRGHLPIIVGGTGLYLRALLEGLFPSPPRCEELRERLRQRVSRRRAGHLHRILQRLDSPAAAKIHANDTAKLIRAIEVCLSARQKMSELWREAGRDPLCGFQILRIGLNPPRQALYDRIDLRARQMFDNGLIEETEQLIKGFPTAGALSSLGYKQVVQLLHGELTRQQALQAVQQAHRNYAKRQLTWFRREPAVHWFHGFGDNPEIYKIVAALVEKAEASSAAGNMS